MDEIRLECLECGARPIVPMSDHYKLPDGPFVNDAGKLEFPDSQFIDASKLELPDGRIIDATDLADEAIADAVRDYLQGMPCPRCHLMTLRITLPAQPGGHHDTCTGSATCRRVHRWC